MPFRIQSEGEVRFEVDVESYGRMVSEVAAIVDANTQNRVDLMIANGLASDIGQSIMEKLLEDSPFGNNLYGAIANNINYTYLVDSIKTQVVGMLMDDARFNTLLQRAINNVTVGAIDETVERVTARLQNEIGIESDV
jgi:hypothetical protein